MAAPAYTRTARELKLPDLCRNADLIRETMATPGWTLVLEAIAAHESKMDEQLLNETTKPDDFLRLRGLIKGLRSMREAAESILELATEREAEANQRTAQELANV